MALVHWQPFRELEEMQRDMNRLVDHLSMARQSGVGFVPAVELEDTALQYRLRLELPGLKPKDVNIEVTSNSVSISGERRSETHSDNQGVTRSEFHYGTFQRVISLPGRINPQEVQADYQQGVLTVTLPKVEEEKHNVVKVQVNS